jgi:DNA invertase Pin-like site-specific DNA recombinase
MKKAFAYLRVSGKGQVNGDGFPRQFEAVKRYAAAHGCEIVDVYREKGVSGTKELENRPALQDLLTALYSNGVRTVIIERLDRLARDLMVQETIIADLRKHGVELISVCEPDLSSDDPSRKLMRQIFGAIAEYDKAMIVLKLKVARQRLRALTGRCEGRKPYGERTGEQEIIGRIIKLRGEGLGMDRIAERLNAEGVKPRTGVKWYPMSISRVLERAEI